MYINSFSSIEAHTELKHVLVLNGNPVVQFHSSDKPLQDSLFLEDNLLVFVLNGFLNIRHGSLEYLVEKNEMAFLRKGRLVEIFSTPDTSDEILMYEFILISLKPDLVKEFMKLAELRLTSLNESQTFINGFIDPRLLGCINSIKYFLFSDEKIGENLIRLKILELLFYIADREQMILEQVLDLREQFRTNITAIVEDNIMNTISLNELAGLSGRSLSSFRRDFLAIYNMSPSKWIREKRLEKASEFLQSTTMTITDICYTLGFENIAHFSRLFKSHFQNSPSAYRLELQQKNGQRE
ncbi:MAG: AraC family transcriptional regulator [Algoriphagus sp.]|nr:AraC family transcriptional regulator [Algoriphagus sp.]